MLIKCIDGNLLDVIKTPSLVGSSELWGKRWLLNFNS